MRKLIFTIGVTLMIFLMSTPVMAGYQLYNLLEGKASIGVGTEMRNYDGYQYWHCVATTTGSPTAVTVSVQASIDGSAYDDIAEHVFDVTEISQGYAMFSIVHRSGLYIRGYLDALVGGTNPTVTLKCMGVK